MNINRHNYETIFLMYVDNELSAAEKKDVNFFVKQNPDLAEELQVLQQSILKPEAIIFLEKSSLLKEETFAALQEKLLLNLDKELQADENRKIEELIANDTVLAKEWNLLLQTKTEADTSVIFDNKESLYKTSRTRVIGFDWLKIAVAAVLIGFGIWQGVSFYINKTKIQKAAIVVTNTIYPRKNIVVPDKLITNQTSINHLSKDTNISKFHQQTLAQQIIGKNIKPIKTIISKQNIKQQQNNIAANKVDTETKQLTNNLPEPYFNSDSSNKIYVSNVSIKRLNDKVADLQMDSLNKNKPDEKLIAIKNENENKGSNIYASSVSLKENNNENNDDNHILYIAEDKLRQSKLGGIFNKVKQTIKNKTKAGIRIANIEIALK